MANLCVSAFSFTHTTKPVDLLDCTVIPPPPPPSGCDPDLARCLPGTLYIYFGSGPGICSGPSDDTGPLCFLGKCIALPAITWDVNGKPIEWQWVGSICAGNLTSARVAVVGCHLLYLTTGGNDGGVIGGFIGITSCSPCSFVYHGPRYVSVDFYSGECIQYDLRCDPPCS